MKGSTHFCRRAKTLPTFYII